MISPATIDPPFQPDTHTGWKGIVIYMAMLIAAALAFVQFQNWGESLSAPELPAHSLITDGSRTGNVNVVVHVLATLAAVLGLGFLLGRAFALLGQPAVIGEVVAGILLGPSLLGAISPDAMHALIPGPDVDPHGKVVAVLQAISQLGVVLYMFLVGLQLNGAKLRDKARSTIAISHASIVAPFVLGAAMALWLYPIVSHRGVSFTSFALFLGAALSVTAFPVLARILTDRGLEKTELGVVALGCAAADDVTAWCLLAFVVGAAQAQMAGAFTVLAGSTVFVLVMFLIVRPLLVWLCRKIDTSTNPLPTAAIPITFIGVLLCSISTEAIGVHAVFGAFLLGAIIPHESRIATEFTRRLNDVVTVLLLPAFFALTGLRTELSLMSGTNHWLICGAIIVIATLGKFGGTFVAARLSGYSSRNSAALGSMMNTRGLMGLIVMEIGLNMGVISPTLFAMMVLMALSTTMATTPLLQWFIPPAIEAPSRTAPVPSSQCRRA